MNKTTTKNKPLESAEIYSIYDFLKKVNNGEITDDKGIGYLLDKDGYETALVKCTYKWCKSVLLQDIKKQISWYAK